jgi:hypothetical protein
MKHWGKEHVYDSAKTSEFGTSFAPWFSDVFHELRPVTRGHRLALVYNLVQHGTSTPQKAAESEGVCKLTDALSRYNSALPEDSRSELELQLPRYLIYRLDHHYTDEGIGLASLKGDDYARVNRLYGAAVPIGFRLYLAKLTKELIPGGDRDDEVLDRSQRFDAVYDLDGMKMDVKPIYEKANMLNLGYNTADEDANESDHEKCTGKEGAPYRHRATVVVIVPPARYVDFFVSGNAGNPSTIIRVIANIPSSPQGWITGTVEYRQLRRLCETVTRKVKKEWSTAEYHRQPAAAAQLTACMDATTMVCFDMDWLQIYSDLPLPFRTNPTGLRILGARLARGPLSGMTDTVLGVVQPAGSFSDQMTIVSDISQAYRLHGTPATYKEEYRDFENNIVLRLLGSSAVAKDQAKDLVGALHYCHATTSIVEAVICKLAASEAPTLAAFVLESDERMKLGHDYCEEAINRALTLLWDKFSFEASAVPAPVRVYASQCDHIWVRKELSQLLYITWHRESSATIADAFTSLARALPSIGSLWADRHILPWLVLFCTEFAGLPRSALSDSSSVKSFLIAAFTAVITKSIGPEPTCPTDFALAPEICLGADYNHFNNTHRTEPCKDCTEINAFLVSPTRTRLEIKAVQHVRTHIDYTFRTDPTYGDFGKGAAPRPNKGTYKTGTKKVGSPHTWWIAKTHMDKFQRQYYNWEFEVRKLRAELKRLAEHENTLFSKQLLGEKEFLAIMSCTVEGLQNAGLVSRPTVEVEMPDSSRARMPLSDGNANAKRKASEISEPDEEDVGRDAGKVPKTPTTIDGGGSGDGVVWIIDLT